MSAKFVMLANPHNNKPVLVNSDHVRTASESDGDAANEDFPQTAVEAPAHLTAPAVPSIELADDGNARRIGRPHRKQHAVGAFVMDELGAKPAVELAMRTLSRQIVVERAQRRPERVRVDVRIIPVKSRSNLKSFEIVRNLPDP